MDMLLFVLTGAYVYPTLLFGWLWRAIDRLQFNHMAHFEERMKLVEKYGDRLTALEEHNELQK